MLMSFRARIRQINPARLWLQRAVPRASETLTGGRLQRTPDGSLWYARYPLGRVRASFDFEQLTQPCAWDRYHDIAHG